jgi:hypothetical protein
MICTIFGHSLRYNNAKFIAGRELNYTWRCNRCGGMGDKTIDIHPPYALAVWELEDTIDRLLTENISLKIAYKAKHAKNKCGTCHFACQCREEKFIRLYEEVKYLRSRADKYEALWVASEELVDEISSSKLGRDMLDDRDIAYALNNGKIA